MLMQGARRPRDLLPRHARAALGIATKKTIVPLSANHNGEHWDIQIDAIYGLCLYKINPNRTIDSVTLDLDAFREGRDTDLSVTTNIAFYGLKAIFVKHVLDSDSDRVIVGKLLYKDLPVGHVYSLARTSVVVDGMDNSAISIVV